MKAPLRRLNRRKRNGFALIVTISLLVLLALEAVGLLTLSTVTVRASGHEAAQSEARTNARLALMLALGEIQNTMGPDSRISARAETLAQHSKVGATVAPNTAKAWWVGISDSDPDQRIGSNEQSVVWLVSGLDPDASAQAQISNARPFEHPVDMYGDTTIDTVAFTGGQPIQAGSVMVQNNRGLETGGFAYFIDDNGMKAQLAASNPELHNDRSPPYGGGVLPGIYDLSILHNMGSLEGTPMADYCTPTNPASRTAIQGRRQKECPSIKSRKNTP